jgi:hypothetical protein
MPLVIRWFVALMVLLVTASCAAPRDDGPAVASMAVSIAPDQAAIGTPIEVRYRFELLPGASMPQGRQLVFVHAVDSSGRMVWTDDHEPPVPTERWQAGRPVEYTRTMFVPRVTVGGPVDLRIGLYSGTTGARVPLQGEPEGDRAYRGATIEVRADPAANFVAYGEGWHNPEIGETLGREWRWSGKVGHLLFRNPKRPAELWLELDQPVAGAATPQQVELRIGGAVVDTFPLDGQAVTVRRTSLTPEVMGFSETVELEVLPAQFFTPASVPALGNADRRELGVRVFNAYVATP